MNVLVKILCFIKVSSEMIKKTADCTVHACFPVIVNICYQHIQMRSESPYYQTFNESRVFNPLVQSYARQNSYNILYNKHLCDNDYLGFLYIKDRVTTLIFKHF